MSVRADERDPTGAYCRRRTRTCTLSIGFIFSFCTDCTAQAYLPEGQSSRRGPARGLGHRARRVSADTDISPTDFTVRTVATHSLTAFPSRYWAYCSTYIHLTPDGCFEIIHTRYAYYPYGPLHSLRFPSKQRIEELSALPLRAPPRAYCTRPF